MRWEGHRAGSTAYRRVAAALVAAGIATYTQLYGIQAVLPLLATRFDASAAQSALAVSLATGGLAGFVLVWSGISDRYGRVRVMVVSLVAATVLGLLAPLAPELWILLAVRALQGVALGGFPAVAVAYLAEEIYSGHLARATGIYVASNTIGGMTGRLAAGIVADLAGWRWGVAADTLLAVAAIAVFLLVIPRPRGFVPRRGRRVGPGLASRLAGSLRDPGLLALYCQALLLNGAFVTVYNFLGFRLIAEPFGLSPFLASFLFVAYLAGSVGAAGAGRVGERLGRHATLLLTTTGMVAGGGALLTGSLAVVIGGLVLFTLMFFAAHTTAAAWVGRRATTGRAQAAAIYTLGYYVGSSVFGWLGGVVFDHAGWAATLGYVAGLCALAAASTVFLSRFPPFADRIRADYGG